MDNKTLKKLFILCAVLIVGLLCITSLPKEEEVILNQSQNIDVESTYNFEKFNYNNLSEEEKKYISTIYSGNVIFTENGVKVYNESVSSGMLNKIITSNWPKDEMGELIPNPEFGEVNRIEYNENWIDIYIENVKESDMKGYLKKLEKYGFNKGEKIYDGKALIQYLSTNNDGVEVKTKFFKETKKIEISVSKNKSSIL